MRLGLSYALFVILNMSISAAAADEVRLYAAGSLRGALTDVSAAFTAATGHHVAAKFGPSGVLKDEIANGANADVFASANMAHPEALSEAHRSGPVYLFARNQLCALARPETQSGQFKPACAASRSGDDTRHVDTESRSFRRLCLGGI